jgi:hypothetical protein
VFDAAGQDVEPDDPDDQPRFTFADDGPEIGGEDDDTFPGADAGDDSFTAAGPGDDEDAGAADAEEESGEDEEDAPEEEAPRLVARGTRKPARAPEPGPSRADTARFALRSLAFVSLTYAGVSAYFLADPMGARSLLREVPLIGASLVETHVNPTSVQLVDVEGRYERVKGDHLVFAISGAAVNNSATAVRGIQIQGRIQGSREERQVVFCGAAPRDLKALSLREIALLQTLDPPADWTLRPTEQARFMIVFSDPPTDLKEFAAEVVAVRGEARSRGVLDPAPPDAEGATTTRASSWRRLPRPSG